MRVYVQLISPAAPRRHSLSEPFWTTKKPGRSRDKPQNCHFCEYLCGQTIEFLLQNRENPASG